MATTTLELELPDELVARFDSKEAALARLREALVLELLREAELSQGQAARLLGISRWDILELMTRHQIPSGPQTAEEARQEVEELRRMLDERQNRGDR